MPDPLGGLGDLDLDAQGNIAIANHAGAVLITTTALNSTFAFNHRNKTAKNFAAWVGSAPPVPEPSSFGAIAVVAALGAANRRPTKKR